MDYQLPRSVFNLLQFLIWQQILPKNFTGCQHTKIIIQYSTLYSYMISTTDNRSEWQTTHAHCTVVCKLVFPHISHFYNGLLFLLFCSSCKLHSQSVSRLLYWDKSLRWTTNLQHMGFNNFISQNSHGHIHINITSERVVLNYTS